MKKIRVLFICVENACRSQIAEGLLKNFKKDFLEVYSAGSKPAKAVNPTAVKVMEEAGIDISSAVPKGFEQLPVKNFDFVFTLGCPDNCPFIPANQHVDWQIADSRGQGLEFFRRVRDEIKQRVEEFVQEVSLQIKYGGEVMERHFDEELSKLNTDLMKMGILTEEAIYRSIEALKAQDKKGAQAVINEDHKIDELELFIEERAIKLLALQQPMARDLRFITTGMKINAELERIADLAVNISQRVIDLSDKPLLKPLIDIPKLGRIARNMVKWAIDAFVSRDKDLAKKVILTDPEADRLRNLVYEELINDYICKKGSTAPQAIPLLLIARHLERICDHATYIAEDIIYMVQAKVVKHHPEKLKNNHRKKL